MKKDYNDTTIGYFYALIALFCWGLMPIYWSFLTELQPLSVVAHRTIWAALSMFIIIVISGKLKSYLSVFTQPKILIILAIATCLLGTNWLIFIIAIGKNKVMESSLGYYINPLLTIVLGMLVFKERLRKLQIIAVILASLAVIYQAINLGAIPFYALGLAATFSVYSVVKKTVRLDGLISLGIESLLLTPIMLIYLLSQTKELGFFGNSDNLHILLLVGAGFATALPLVWFSNAARKLPLTTLGFLNFLAPTISLFLAIFYFHEKFTQTHGVTFLLIGAALVLYAIDLVKNHNVKKQDIKNTDDLKC